MVLIHWCQHRNFPWQPHPSALTFQRSCLPCSTPSFFFPLKYLVIFPGTEELLVEEKKFLEGKARVCIHHTPGHTQRGL